MGSAGPGSIRLSFLSLWHQDARASPGETPTHVIDTVLVSGQEKYLIVSAGVRHPCARATC